jgi:anti-sigma factor RsiW
VKFEDLQGLPHKPPRCPPDLELHRLVNGELDWKSSRKVAEHCETCAVCASKVTEFGRAASTPPEGDELKTLETVASRIESGGGGRSSDT